MKIVVFSDIHGNQDALQVFTDALRKTGYDQAVFLGDIFGYYYRQKEVIESLRQIPGLLWLKGNHDQYAIDLLAGREDAERLIRNYGHSYAALSDKTDPADMEFLNTLPSMAEREYDGVKFGFFHGTPADPLEGRLYPDNEITDILPYQKYDYVVLGHTHCQMKRKAGDTTILNPGSVGQPRDGRGHCFATIDTKTGETEFVTIPVDRTGLYEQIDRFDPDLAKLKEVLERKPK
ncbi:MAG: metallophosphoesterase family protein [Lachnospiraceae bacterium]|nr:metallophosphoesterase family protein [Lachnospiraceae bacterium]